MGLLMEWTSSDPSVLRVVYDSTRSASTHDVLFVPVSAGRATVTATCLGLTGSSAVDVLVDDSLTMVFGELVDLP